MALLAWCLCPLPEGPLFSYLATWPVSAARTTRDISQPNARVQKQEVFAWFVAETWGATTPVCTHAPETEDNSFSPNPQINQAREKHGWGRNQDHPTSPARAGGGRVAYSPPPLETTLQAISKKKGPSIDLDVENKEDRANKARRTSSQSACLSSSGTPALRADGKPWAGLPRSLRVSGRKARVCFVFASECRAA